MDALYRKPPRRTTPSRRRRNQARRDVWLAKKKEKHQDNHDPVEDIAMVESISEITKDLKVVEEMIDSTFKNLKILAEDLSTQLIHSIEKGQF